MGLLYLELCFCRIILTQSKSAIFAIFIIRDSVVDWWFFSECDEIWLKIERKLVVKLLKLCQCKYYTWGISLSVILDASPLTEWSWVIPHSTLMKDSRLKVIAQLHCLIVLVIPFMNEKQFCWKWILGSIQNLLRLKWWACSYHIGVWETGIFWLPMDTKQSNDAMDHW